uniref:Shikimate kinase n=1 Tax=Candidatus Kentrum sp. DK TaxID=2126562 RepID=A0A450S4T3_9GAMM|nr:MAG: shikimate kinase [Candidatus Kentron sp. DK]
MAKNDHSSAPNRALKGNIFLVGPMGAGKTSVGRYLARFLEKRFLDSDREIEQHTGAAISRIFELEGEAGFRRREQAMIEQLTRETDIVLATGGGVVLNRENRACLIHRGTVVYLHAPIERLVRRTAGDKNRPLLHTADPRGKLEEIMEEREPLYRQVADQVVGTEGKSPKQLAGYIARSLSG